MKGIKIIFISMLIAAFVFAVPGFACSSPPVDPGTATATATATNTNTITNTANGGNGYGGAGGQGGQGGNATATIQKGAIDNTNLNTNLNMNSNTIQRGAVENNNSNTQRQNQDQKQRQNQSQQQAATANNSGNAQTLISERDFLGNPMPANTNLINYSGPYRSLYASLAPWEFAGYWNADNLKGFDTCYWGCSVQVSSLMTAKESKSFKMGKGKKVLAIVIAKASDPLAMWGNVANEALKRGATSVEARSIVSTFKTKSTGASFYLSGGISAIRNDGGQAVAGASGIGFGTASAETIETVSAVFILYTN
jgi:hypothetical protein